MFSTEAADRLMDVLEVTGADLLWADSGATGMGVRGVPVLRTRIGPGVEVVFTVYRGTMPFPAGLLEGLVQPLAARLAPDLVLPRELAANDVVLLDQNPVIRQNPAGRGIWLIEDEGGVFARYLRRDVSELYIANNLTIEHPDQWHAIKPRHNLLDIVRARIVWIGREIS